MFYTKCKSRHRFHFQNQRTTEFKMSSELLLRGLSSFICIDLLHTHSHAHKTQICIHNVSLQKPKLTRTPLKTETRITIPTPCKTPNPTYITIFIAYIQANIEKPLNVSFTPIVLILYLNTECFQNEESTQIKQKKRLGN